MSVWRLQRRNGQRKGAAGRQKSFRGEARASYAGTWAGHDLGLQNGKCTVSDLALWIQAVRVLQGGGHAARRTGLRS